MAGPEQALPRWSTCSSAAAGCCAVQRRMLASAFRSRTASLAPPYTVSYHFPMASSLVDQAKSLLGDFSRVVCFDAAGQQVYTSCKVRSGL